MYNTADYDPEFSREAIVRHEAETLVFMFGMDWDEALRIAEKKVGKTQEDNWE